MQCTSSCTPLQQRDELKIQLDKLLEANCYGLRDIKVSLYDQQTAATADVPWLSTPGHFHDT